MGPFQEYIELDIFCQTQMHVYSSRFQTRHFIASLQRKLQLACPRLRRYQLDMPED
jgi:hypothetical protein